MVLYAEGLRRRSIRVYRKAEGRVKVIVDKIAEKLYEAYNEESEKVLRNNDEIYCKEVFKYTFKQGMRSILELLAEK